MFYGVDVGQAGDPAAEVAVVPAGRRPGGGPRPVWRVVGAGRVPRGSYRDLVEHVAARSRALSAGDREVMMAVDATGCGRPVVEMIRDRLGAGVVLGVTFTAGRRPGGQWPDVTVPKRVLVDHVQVALERDGLVALGAPGGEDLVGELRRYVDRAGKFDAVSGHDDLVAALMLAVWLGDTVAEQISRREGVEHECLR